MKRVTFFALVLLAISGCNAFAAVMGWPDLTQGEIKILSDSDMPTQVQEVAKKFGSLKFPHTITLFKTPIGYEFLAINWSNGDEENGRLFKRLNEKLEPIPLITGSLQLGFMVSDNVGQLEILPGARELRTTYWMDSCESGGWPIYYYRINESGIFALTGMDKTDCTGKNRKPVFRTKSKF